MNTTLFDPGSNMTQVGALWVKSALCLCSEPLPFWSHWDKHVFHSGFRAGPPNQGHVWPHKAWPQGFSHHV